MGVLRVVLAVAAVLLPQVSSEDEGTCDKDGGCPTTGSSRYCIVGAGELTHVQSL